MRKAAHNFAKRSPVLGFTLLELMLGMLVTALVMGALAALLAAVAQGWKQTGATQSKTSLAALTNLRLQRTLRATCLIGAVRAGSLDGGVSPGAAMLLWRADNNSDYKIQFSEMALLEYHYDPDLQPPYNPQTIRLYKVAWPANWTSEQKQAADVDVSDTEFYSDATIDNFRKLQYVSDTYTVLARNVTGCVFHSRDSASTTRPSVDYELKIAQNGANEMDMGTVTVRTPATLPVSQR